LAAAEKPAAAAAAELGESDTARVNVKEIDSGLPVPPQADTASPLPLVTPGTPRAASPPPQQQPEVSEVSTSAATSFAAMAISQEDKEQVLKMTTADIWGRSSWGPAPTALAPALPIVLESSAAASDEP
jgi:hypothetical protein